MTDSSYGHTLQDAISGYRLMLGSLESELSADKHSLPFILQRFDKDGSVLKGPPGYQVKYVVDPVYMTPGEGPLFVKYLANQTLHIDVWDGDSLLLIGSCLVELKVGGVFFLLIGCCTRETHFPRENKIAL